MLSLLYFANRYQESAYLATFAGLCEQINPFLRDLSLTLSSIWILILITSRMRETAARRRAERLQREAEEKAAEAFQPTEYDDLP